MKAKEALLLKKSKDLFCIQKQKSPLRGYFANFWKEKMEARAGVEPTYTDLQSGA